MTEAGFDIKPGDHPIVPIMLYDAVIAQNFAAKLLEENIYVIGFFLSCGCKRFGKNTCAIERRTRTATFG